ncbi:MAG: hypothetical protein HQL89_13875, partial [Magnetococcales bacterium]|nr:hypothetical protein [Magnetococcales bacterium]
MRCFTVAQRLVIQFRTQIFTDHLVTRGMGASANLGPTKIMGDQKEKNRSQYDTTLKDLFEKPPQRLLQ